MDLRKEGVKKSITRSIFLGYYLDRGSMQGTHTSLISRDDMTKVLIHHLLANAKRIRLMRNKKLAEYKGTFLPSLLCVTVLSSVTTCFTLQSTLKTPTTRAQQLPSLLLLKQQKDNSQPIFAYL